jgi:ubiquinol-cytochrome c reductase cytochrome c subunit
VRAVLLAAASLALCAGCGLYRTGPPQFRPGIPSPAPNASGAEIFQRDCAWCHGSAGQGTDKAPALKGSTGKADVDFMLRTGRMPLSDPHEQMLHRPAVYTEKQIKAVGDYVVSLGAKGPDIPRVRTSEALRPKGLMLYQSNCAACHSSTGIGGALVPGKTEVRGRISSIAAPALTLATPLEVAEAIRTGPGAMPSYDTGSLSNSDVDAIASYVSYIQHPKDRGGASISRVGPVAEGAVAWGGLILLLFFARWIGTRER